MIGDGNLLTVCNTEKQVDKARKIVAVGKVRVAKTESRDPMEISDDNRGAPQCQCELTENLKVRNSTVKTARRITKRVGKKDRNNND